MDNNQVNMFIKPIFDKRKKHHFKSYIELRRLIKNINKTSPSFDMMIEIHEFLKIIRNVYMYADYENHNLFLAEIPKNYDAAMIYKESNFAIKYVLKKKSKLIMIEITRNTIKEDKEIISFCEGDDIIKNVYDEQKFLFIISCLMNSVVNLMKYYYNNKRF